MFRRYVGKDKKHCGVSSHIQTTKIYRFPARILSTVPTCNIIAVFEQKLECSVETSYYKRCAFLKPLLLTPSFLTKYVSKHVLMGDVHTLHTGKILTFYFKPSIWIELD
jgi:hypothetical protein